MSCGMEVRLSRMREAENRECSKWKASEDLKYKTSLMEKGTELDQHYLTLDYLTRATQR